MVNSFDEEVKEIQKNLEKIDKIEENQINDIGYDDCSKTILSHISPHEDLLLRIRKDLLQVLKDLPINLEVFKSSGILKTLANLIGRERRRKENASMTWNKTLDDILSLLNAITERCEKLTVNEAITLKLVRRREDMANSFKSEMFYEIFGKRELASWLDGMKINIYYVLGNLCNYIEILGKEDNQIVEDRYGRHLKSIVSKKLSSPSIPDIHEFHSTLEEDLIKFKPVGTNIGQFTVRDEDGISQFVVYHGYLKTKRIKLYVKKLRTLAMFFNHGARFIDVPDDEDRRCFFFVFKKCITAGEISYTFAGYANVYEFWMFRPEDLKHQKEEEKGKESEEEKGEESEEEKGEESEEEKGEESEEEKGEESEEASKYLIKWDNNQKLNIPPFNQHIRPNISQMLVLPPFQRLGIGSKFLQIIYDKYISNECVLDVTAKDPSEAFTRLRDFVDCSNCMKLDSFSSENLKKGFSETMVTESGKKYKIHKKQVRRIYEILLLKATEIDDEDEYEKFRSIVKSRLEIPVEKKQRLITILEKRRVPIEAIEAILGCKPDNERKKTILDKEYQRLEEEYNHVISRLGR